MIDDEFQLPVLEARWLGDAAVPRERKRAFLLDSTDGEPRARRMLRELALVSRLTAAYVADPLATNLVSFPQRDSTQWQSASWRDSNAGYAGGRFAMDVNADLGAARARGNRRGVRRATRSGHRSRLRSARGARRCRHRGASPLRARRHGAATRGRCLARSRRPFRGEILSDRNSRTYDGSCRRAAGSRATDIGPACSAALPVRDTLSFLALSLDAAGNPIAVANSDPSTRLFLARRSVRLGSRLASCETFGSSCEPYPVGLFIDGVGPVVANDAYASPAIWPRFESDHYHGPRVVWGREVNLFMLGVMNQIADRARHGVRERAARRVGARPVGRRSVRRFTASYGAMKCATAAPSRRGMAPARTFSSGARPTWRCNSALSRLRH